MNKTRPAHDQAAITQVIGGVAGKIAIMGDDMIATGGTLIAGVEALKEPGATRRLRLRDARLLLRAKRSSGSRDAGIAGIVVTDTVPIDPLRRPSNITVLPVSRLLADTIRNVFSDESVSAIFGGREPALLALPRSRVAP